MANPNPSQFLSNVHWKLAKQLKNDSNFYSIFHSATVTANLFEILLKHQGIHLKYKIKFFPHF